jgi:hypothetical protein
MTLSADFRSNKPSLINISNHAFQQTLKLMTSSVDFASPSLINIINRAFQQTLKLMTLSADFRSNKPFY